MRCIYLRDTKPEDVPLLLENVINTNATLIIIINHLDSFELDSNVFPLDIQALPIIVLHSSSGVILERILEKSTDAAVMATLSLEAENETPCLMGKFTNNRL